MYMATDKLVMVGVVSRSFEISERAAKNASVHVVPGGAQGEGVTHGRIC